MLKKILFFFIAIHSFNVGISQNLVPNPGFEDTVQCPLYGGPIEFAKGWINPTHYSPDYLNSCAMNVPNNYYGIQNAHTGIAYAGIIGHTFIDLREYIQTKLLDSLQNGKYYKVDFFVSLAEGSPYAINQIGVCFSKFPIASDNLFYLPYVPQIENNQSNFLKSETDWMKISGSFIAQGGEQYITIGNFRNDAMTDTMAVKDSFWVDYSYYYIDDVSVTIDSTVTAINPISKPDLKIYPNPATDQLHIEALNIHNAAITILNLFGQVVLQQEFSDNASIHISFLPKGMYLVNITDEKGDVKQQGKVVKE
ncbi:MAG: T9SS type A sorting domain-containing protein [Chitinophagales bacterium]|nr:T9SS type A sorting domain-containing protein [Chitinophagales bacterium]